jgi:hypothetical protein
MIISALKLKDARRFVKILRPDKEMNTTTKIQGVEIFPVPLHNHQDALDARRFA